MKKGKQLYCNVCGKEFKIERGILKEGVFEVNIEWGYFSSRDLEVHKFDMCECCYDKMVRSFAIPITVTKSREVL